MNTQFDAPASEQILMEFTSTLHTLTIQPGNIEEYMDPLIDLLKKVADGDIAQKMVEILFDQVYFLIMPLKQRYIYIIVFIPFLLQAFCVTFNENCNRSLGNSSEQRG